jgi:hypothetical protein
MSVDKKLAVRDVHLLILISEKESARTERVACLTRREEMDAHLLALG